MGGRGSGEWYRWECKSVVEDCYVLDANRWMQEGILRERIHEVGSWGWWNARTGEKTSSVCYEVDTTDRPYLRLWYTITRTEEKLDYRFRLKTTRPHFGGLRWWFKCPLTVNDHPCQRQCGKLYLPPGGKYYGCRICYNLAYESQRESQSLRMIRRADKIRRRLGASSQESPLVRPKGMHQRTYSRLAMEERWLRSQSWVVFAAEQKFTPQRSTVG